MDKKTPPKGTVVTSEVVAEMAADEVMNNLQHFFPKELFETIPAEAFEKIVETVTGFGMKVGTMVASNRADLNQWVTAKTATTIVGNPDHCEINAPGITYELRYTMTERGPGGNTSRSYTYEEAVHTFGEGAVDEMWGAFGHQGTCQMVCGDTTYWFSTSRVPVEKTFEVTIRQEATQGASLSHGSTQTESTLEEATRNIKEPESQMGTPTFG